MPDVPSIPAGFHTLTPHLVVQDSRQLIDFYQRAFGAEPLALCSTDEQGHVMHARVRIGDSIVMLNDEFPEQGVLAPQAGATPVTLHLYTEDVDAMFARAVAAGATVLMPPADMFWGDRYSMVTDPAGHRWAIATQQEVLSDEDIAERARTAFSGGASGS